MTQVEAIYENGVLRPLTPLGLAERQRVRVWLAPELPPLSPEERMARFREIAARREKLREEIGTLEDSTALIREDRMRDI